MGPQSEVTYRHTQRGAWHLILYAFAVVTMAPALFITGPDFVRWLMVGLGTLFLILGASFQYLTVEDAGDRLAVRFGPLPFFQTGVPYDDIREVKVGRTRLLEGWGIHPSLHGGQVWNIWGYDCVVIDHRRGTLHVGSDDAPNLAAFLKSRIGARS